MTGGSRRGIQGFRTDDIAGFLRKSALVKETDGKPSLTSKGEMFLQELQASSSRAPRESNSPDGPSFSEGAFGV